MVAKAYNLWQQPTSLPVPLYGKEQLEIELNSIVVDSKDNGWTGSWSQNLTTRAKCLPVLQ
jgi:hypothetical protein